MATTENITGTIQKIAQEKTSQGNQMAVIEIIPDGGQYPWTMRAFDEEVIAWCLGLEKGQWAAFKVQVTEKEGRNGSMVKYRNILGSGETRDVPNQIEKLKTIEQTGLPPEGSDKDKLIVDQVLTKIAADIYRSRDYTSKSDISPESCAAEALRMWRAIRNRHIEQNEVEESSDDEVMEVL